MNVNVHVNLMEQNTNEINGGITLNVDMSIKT